MDRTLSASVTAATLIFLVLLFWGVQGHREASRSGLRADSLATEILIERARADGWEAVAADTAAQLLELLAASDSQDARLSREIEALRARPIARTVAVVSSGGISEAPRDSTTSAADTDSTTYLVSDGPLSGRFTTWADSPFGRFDWSFELTSEFVHAEGADKRGMIFARPLGSRGEVSVIDLDYQPLTAEPRGFPWGCIASAGGTGASAAGLDGAARVIAVGVGALLTHRQCR